MKGAKEEHNVAMRKIHYASHVPYLPAIQANIESINCCHKIFYQNILKQTMQFSKIVQHDLASTPNLTMKEFWNFSPAVFEIIGRDNSRPPFRVKAGILVDVIMTNTYASFTEPVHTARKRKRRPHHFNYGIWFFRNLTDYTYLLSWTVCQYGFSYFQDHKTT